MEFYPHQQQQQQHQTTQQVDSMATGSMTSTSATNITNNNNNNNNNFNNSSSSCTPPTSSTVDAATVAIAKDMLQLHHGGSVNNNNNTNNNNNNNISNAATEIMNASSNINNNNAMIASSSNTPPAHCSSNAGPPDNALGFLKFDNELLYITESCTIIGRNSSTSHVHFHVAENNLVSRKHFQVLFDAETRDFYVQCLSKNGIFVDDFLQRRNADPLKLPPSCYFRFPSTEIRIQFESFMHVSNNPSGSISSSGVVSSSYALGNHVGDGAADLRGGSGGSAHVIISPAPPDEHQQHSHLLQHSSASSISSTTTSHLLPMDSSNAIYSPLKISIPKKEQKSPYLSPTGTISAANSCPASPRQGYHQHQSNYNNYGNNNLQNQDLFQTPSTASYNHNEKPPYSYAQLIVQAISAAPDKQLTLSGIYSFIVKHYPYYRKETNKGWQNSIRHNLSLNRYFIKVARSQDEPGKGSFWRIDPDSGAKLIDHSYKKRRQRSSQGFRPPFGMPRSAPVSPSHMDYIADNSRESSPLQDIVLQSAPGSPGLSLENRAAESDIVYSSQSSANNSHNQYNTGSPYYATSNQNSTIVMQQSHSESGGGGGSSGNGVGALIALKRNHAMAAGAAAAAAASANAANLGHHQQQSLHPDIIYEEMSGNIESGDECEAAKRPKYISEVL